MTKKEKRARTARRQRRRAAVKQIRAREKLGRAAPGGSPGRAISVSTPAVIASLLRSMRCYQCGGELDPAELTAPSTSDGLRRLAATRCRRCHAPREVWFSIGPTVN